MGAVDAGFAEAGVCGVGDYVCFALGGHDLRGEWLCAVEFFAVECSGAGSGGGGVVGWSGDSGGWAGAARFVAAPGSGLLWVVVLGLELCGRYGGLAGAVVPVAGWADCCCGSGERRGGTPL